MKMTCLELWQPLCDHEVTNIRMKTNTWRKKKEKIERFMEDKWIPESDYELDYSTDAFEMEYHDKRDAENTRIIILYFAVKPKKREVQ